jgi:hypothetical protein
MSKSFRGQIGFVGESRAVFCKHADFAIRSILKTGELAHNSPEKYLHLQTERGESKSEIKPSLFFLCGIPSETFCKIDAIRTLPMLVPVIAFDGLF